MHSAYRPPLMKLTLSKMACLVFLFCAATAIPSAAQTLTTLYSFCSQQNCADGGNPNATLVQAKDGNFYGTTISGGTGQYCPFGGCGTVYRITPGGVLTTLYNFCSHSNCADGLVPQAALVQGTDGNFYGTTSGGGASQNCTVRNGCGTVFKITMSGALTTLYSFCSQPNCSDGSLPLAGMVQASDGNYYGTTSEGGSSTFYSGGAGTVFRITPTGSLTTLYEFCSQTKCTDGLFPSATMVQAVDGDLYGTTTQGGANYTAGEVFKITLSGSLTRLYSFCSQPDCTDGYLPNGLIQGSDGDFYGTTGSGGINNGLDAGTVFKVTPTGTLTTLYSFCPQYPCVDGAMSGAALVQATDGNFYGTTYEGGAYNFNNCVVGCGTAFKIAPSGALTTLYSFCSLPDCTDGNSPVTALVQATNGNLYGTTSSGGANGGGGTVFRLLGPNPAPLQFVAAMPCRLVDTRQTGTPIQGGTWQAFVIPQLGGCNIPTTAAAYSLNVTVVPYTTLGYLTIWPTGEDQPVVSTMNSPDGRVKANAAIVPAGGNGAVSVYVTDTTNVILDIDGYFATPGAQTYQFYALTPCRLVDTRGADGNLGGPRLLAQTPRTFPLLESSCISAGLNPLAYSLNFTVVPNPSGQSLGYLTVWPTGETQPVVSTLNNPTGTVVANGAIVPAGTGGAVDVYAYNTTDLLIDINGYFAAPGTGGFSMYPVAPCRVLDTRHSGGAFVGEKTVSVEGSACAPPSNAAAYIFNATVVPPGSMPYLTLWPDGEQEPVVSTLNAYDGFITSNMAIVPTNNGSIDAYAYALTQLILDISGYFAP
ncbi:MAG: choice-of-anchor tandem repeat GloVer-containing protein [Candidatus Korobacteraceae bacterium]